MPGDSGNETGVKGPAMALVTSFFCLLMSKASNIIAAAREQAKRP